MAGNVGAAWAGSISHRGATQLPCVEDVFYFIEAEAVVPDGLWYMLSASDSLALSPTAISPAAQQRRAAK
jgi:hypothetical protein